MIRQLAADALKDLLARQRAETQTLEFKRSLNLRKEACIALCGMVNAEPAQGVVVFGIEPDGSVVGVEAGNLDTAQRTLTEHLRQTFEPLLSHTIEVVEVEGERHLLMLNAQRDRRIPFHEYDGAAYVREGSTSRKLKLAEKEQLKKRRDRDSHNGPWLCNSCGSWVGILHAPVITVGADGKPHVTKGYHCGCGGEYWPA